MSKQEIGAKEFIIGAAIGGIVGTIGALLLTPKTGNRFRKELAEYYDNISDHTHDLAGIFAKKGNRFAKNLHAQAGDWTEKVKSLVGDLKDCVGCNEEDGNSHSKIYAIGAIAGGILGAAAWMLLSPKSDEERFRNNILGKYKSFSNRTQDYVNEFDRQGKFFTKQARSKTHQWLDLAKDVVDSLLDNSDEMTENLTENLSAKVKSYADSGHGRLSDVLDWASIGFKVWNSISKKR